MKISFQQYYFSLIVALIFLDTCRIMTKKVEKSNKKKQEDFSPCVVKCSQPNGGERFIFRAGSKATGVTLKNTVTDFSFNPISLDHVRVMPGNKEHFFLQKGGDTNVKIVVGCVGCPIALETHMHAGTHAHTSK